MSCRRPRARHLRFEPEVARALGATPSLPFSAAGRLVADQARLPALIMAATAGPGALLARPGATVAILRTTSPAAMAARILGAN